MIELHHTTLRDMLPHLRTCAIDAVVTDPPYAPRVHGHMVSTGVGPRGAGYAHIDDALRHDVGEVISQATGWSVVCHDVESGHLWRRAVKAPCEHIRTIPWVRWSQPQMTGDRPPSGAELVSVWHPPPRKVWSGPGSLVCFDHRSLRCRGKYPGEKPLDLALSLVSWFSLHGGTVVDPCCGAGTIALACQILGRCSISLDISAEAVALARRRLADPPSAHDRDRAMRWVDAQRAWASEAREPSSVAGSARYARARADADRAEAWCA